MISFLDRSIAPEAKEIEDLTILKSNKKQFHNGISFYTINAGKEEVIRLEAIFDAGNWNEKVHLSSNVVNTLIIEGTSSMSGSQIADFFDFHGAFLQTEVDFDRAYVTLYCLNKHLETLLPVFSELIFRPTFPQNELDTFIANNKQKLAVNKKKNDYECRKIFNEKLFGSEHPYGFNAQMQDMDLITRDSLVLFHHQYYTTQNCTLIIAGKLTDTTISTVENHFAEISSTPISYQKVIHKNHFPEIGKTYIEKSDALQTAIRIGIKAIQKTHPDYIGFQILSTILGGYFGSRLMANIREDKGYTYGIGSRLVSLQQDAYFFISTEVGKEVHEATLVEIFKEIERLKTENVSDSELDLVRNYLLGTMLGSIENAFSHADKLKGILFYGLDYDYYDQFIHIVKTISADEIKSLAKKYLKIKEFTSVLVG